MSSHQVSRLVGSHLNRQRVAFPSVRTAGQASTRVGTLFQPATFCIVTRLQLARSTSKRGMKSSIMSRAMELSSRASAAPRQLCRP